LLVVVIAVIVFGSAYSAMNTGYVYFSQIYEIMTEEHLSYSQARKKIQRACIIMEQQKNKNIKYFASLEQDIQARGCN